MTVARREQSQPRCSFLVVKDVDLNDQRGSSEGRRLGLKRGNHGDGANSDFVDDHRGLRVGEIAFSLIFVNNNIFGILSVEISAQSCSAREGQIA